MKGSSINLGNTRITLDGSNTVYGEHHYYPFGLEMPGLWKGANAVENDYLYNGKELNKDFSLNLYDYGARFYDPAIARWTSTDPLAEIIPNHSLYAYVFNNPIAFNDPTGMMGEQSNVIASTHVDTEGNFIWHYDDGDDNVYVPDKGTTKDDLDNASSEGTSHGGDNAMGNGRRARALQKHSAQIYMADQFLSGNIDRFEYLMGLNALDEDYGGMGMLLLDKHKWDLASYVPWFVWLKWVRAEKGTQWVYGSFKSSQKWANQLAKRGWTEKQIAEAIRKGKQYSATNKVNPGNAATRFVHPTTGQSVVIDKVTKELLHVGGPGFKY